MTANDDAKKSSQANSHQDRSDNVGYGRPPRAYTWKPGQSGNPKGRRQGAKNEKTILRELLEKKLEIQQNGKIRKLTVREAMLLKCVDDALKGDHKARVYLLEKYAPIEAERIAKAKRLREATRTMSKEDARKRWEEERNRPWEPNEDTDD
jgi:hypothetical protein